VRRTNPSPEHYVVYLFLILTERNSGFCFRWPHFTGEGADKLVALSAPVFCLLQQVFWLYQPGQLLAKWNPSLNRLISNGRLGGFIEGESLKTQ
jgi:hypothetical protein